jgi:hypothetical protein
VSHSSEFCVTSQRMFVVVVVFGCVYSFIDSVRKLLDTPSCVVNSNMDGSDSVVGKGKV